MRPATSRLSLSIAAAMVAISFSATLQAQSLVREFNVTRQQASSGVRAFAEQAGFQVIVSADDARNRVVNGVSGPIPTREALDRLIAGTGLVVRSFDNNVAVLGAEPAPTVPRESGDDVSTLANVVVTGSRIARPELDSPMPVSVIDMEAMERIGIDSAEDALRLEPSIGSGIGRYNAQGQGFDGGMAAISLRNMGTNRSLTLVDGRRRVSGSARSSAVDVNMIPSGMIERIEVVTGGAAAIYGADAVTGAVNVITKSALEGFQSNVRYGISDRGDAQTKTASASFGNAFAEGRGHFSVGGTYSDSEGLRTHDRPRTHAGRVIYGVNPANTAVGDGIPDRIIHYDFGEFYYNDYPTFLLDNVNYGYTGGEVRELYIHTPLNARGEFFGGDGAFQSDIRPLTQGDQLRAPIRQAAAIARVDYDITDSVRYTGRIDLGKTRYEGTKSTYREDSRTSWLNGAGSAWAYLDNPYLPAPMRDFMTDQGLQRLRISRAFVGFGLFEDIHERELWTIDNTLSGGFDNGMQWEAFAQYGRNKGQVSNPNTVRVSHWIAARDAVADPSTGAPVCRSEEMRAKGCMPFNIFDSHVPTDAEAAWIFGNRRERRTNTQAVFGASLTGTAFTLQAGDASFAVGAEHRRESLDTQEDPLAKTGELAHNASVSAHAELSESMRVSEAYGELVAPLLADVAFAERLEVEGAYRYSHYDSFGGTEAWKAGVTWTPIRGVTFRGVRSHSVRAPNFGELYEPINTGTSNLADPCENIYTYETANRLANCQALGIAVPPPNSVAVSHVVSGGNPDLQPETSDSVTYGVILQPGFLPGLSATADYWDIDIKDVVTQLSANALLDFCVDMPSIDNPFCRQIIRDSDPARTVLHVSTQQMNAARFLARGVDFGLNYSRALGPGYLRMNLKATRLIQKQQQGVPGIETSTSYQEGGRADPVWRGTLLTGYSVGDFDITLNTRYTGSAVYDRNRASEESFENDEIPAIRYTDLSLGWHVNDSFRVTAGVTNLSDKQPPFLPSIYMGEGGRYDIVGRRYFVSVNARF